MADEVVEEEGAKKSPMVKIIIFAVVGLILLAGAVVGTLFAVGFFDKKDHKAAEEKLHELEAHAANAAASAASAPVRSAKKSPEIQRFESTYMELEKPLLVNMANSRKAISAQVALMTYYDDRVFKNVKKHEFALRAASLDVLRQVTEDMLTKPDFRKDVAAKIRDEMNAVLMKYEDFGGIEEVYFTTFLIQ
ncbi:MAG: hypothetical protein RI949_1551 [Pseudomonadota bacterium]|jgi:flagellar FliL protein